ncbi:hypothetical protein CDL15_Pgr017713 [Punica granatum]|uniref:DUF630 domain-containing protein n=1 Tax=Punica granatum TaxID=22663 RepID=A0A218WHI9_PUNGR|nr:hypothetical protein CDL15_Pgr017713 [Punica granatum]PKI37567.1 hypothetical protein CRG98_042038 [Punica granatum]
MGRLATKLEQEGEAVAICWERKKLLKQAVDGTLSRKPTSGCQALYAVSAAIKLCFETKLQRARYEPCGFNSKFCGLNRMHRRASGQHRASIEGVTEAAVTGRAAVVAEQGWP